MSPAIGCSVSEEDTQLLTRALFSIAYSVLSKQNLSGLWVQHRASQTQQSTTLTPIRSDQVIASNACFSTRISRDMYLLSKTINCPLDMATTRKRSQVKKEYHTILASKEQGRQKQISTCNIM